MKKEDLTGIHFLEKTSYYDGNASQTENILWIFLALLSFMGVILSSLAMFFGRLHMSFSWVGLIVIILVPTLILWTLSWRWQTFVAAFGALAVAGGLYAWFSRDALTSGFGFLYDRVRILAMDYIAGTKTVTMDAETLEPSVMYVIALILVLYGSFWFFFLKKVMPVLFPGILVILAILLVGLVPQPLWLGLFAFFALILMSVGALSSRFGKYGTLTALAGHFYIRQDVKAARKIGAKTGIFMGAVLGLCLVLAAAAGNIFGMPKKEVLQDYQEQVRSWFDEHLKLGGDSSGNYENRAGSISGGDLANVGDLYYYGDEQLHISMDERPGYTLYIKGYAGDIYGTNQWLSGESGAYAQFLTDNGLNAEEEIQLLGLPYELLKSQGSGRVTIKKLANFGDYMLYPYGMQNHSKLTWAEDLYLMGKEESADFTYAKAFYPLMGSYEQLLAAAWPYKEQTPEAAENEWAYKAFVYDHYLQVPGQLKPVLDDFMGEGMPEDLREKMLVIRKALANACSYTLTPGDLPAGEDFTEYFLTKNRQGYCMHFATAATLLLRNAGIPARYAEGFLVGGASFAPTAQGYEATVYDYEAHAWTEIYLDGFGWIPVEMTPTFYEDTSLAPESEAREESTEASEQSRESMTESTMASEASDEEMTQDTPAPEAGDTKKEEIKPSDTIDKDNDDRGNNGQGQGGGAGGLLSKLGAVLVPILLILLALAVCIGAAVAIIYFRAAAVVRHKKAMMRQKDRSKALICVYHQLLTLFKVAGFSQDAYKNSWEYFDAVAKAYDCVDADALNRLESLANKAAFSRGGIEFEQWQESFAMYVRLRKGFLEKQTWWRKLLWRYIYCL